MIKKGSTGSTNTGPSGALIGSYYKYIETSGPREPGNNATMVSNMVFEGYTCYLSDLIANVRIYSTSKMGHLSEFDDLRK